MLLAVWPYTVVRAQVPDTVFRYYPQLTQYVVLDSPDVWQPVDTTVRYLYRYHAAEAPLAGLHLGYLGAPARLNLPPYTNSWGLRTGFHAYDLYRQDFSRIRFYDSRQPYTVLGYQQGSKQELQIRVLHTQNILPRLGAGFSYLRRRTDGGYQRQLTRRSDGHVFFHYRDSVGRYRAFVAALLSTHYGELNGGILSDTVFDDRTLFNKKLVPVVLKAAEEHMREQGALIVNTWNLISEKRRVGQEDLPPSGQSMLRLEHRLSWEGFRRIFHDDVADSLMYPLPLPAMGIRDSFNTNCLRNTVRFLWRPSALPLHALMQVMQEQWWVRQGDLHYLADGISVGGEVVSRPGQRVELGFDGYITLAGRNRGDFFSNPSAEWQAGGQHLRAELAFLRRQPDLTATRYHSAVCHYEVTPEAFRFRQIRLLWKVPQPGPTLSVAWLKADNLLYWRETGAPHAGNLQGLQLMGHQLLRLHPIHLELEALGQWYDTDTVMSLPELTGRGSIYYEDRWFGGAALFLFGVELAWKTPYELPAYLPALGRFAEQREFRWRSHPQADAYVVLQVRGVRVFALLQQAFQGILGSGNFYGYRYPGPDRSFKIGVEWWFWN